MKTIRRVEILAEISEDQELPWAVYIEGRRVARFVSLILAKAYKSWLDEI